MDRIYTSYFETSYGELILGDHDGRLCLCDWRNRKLRKQIDLRILKGLNASFEDEETKILKETKKQLIEYFNGERTIFELPIKFVGTDFQKEVWRELKNISFGETETYSGLSRKMKNEKAIRAIASANGANAISIIVPCHRVIGINEKLVGYAGGLQVKKKLLELEGYFNNSKQLKLF